MDIKKNPGSAGTVGVNGKITGINPWLHTSCFKCAFVFGAYCSSIVSFFPEIGNH